VPVGALLTIVLLAVAPAHQPDLVRSLAPADSLIRRGETHFAHLWRATWDGQNACPRWSPDGDVLVLEIGRKGCGQVYLAAAGHQALLASEGTGLATSPALLGRCDALVFSATPASPDSCHPSANRWHDEKWPLYAESHLFVRAKGEVHQLTKDPGAVECNASPNGKQIVYTATPAIDPELYVMNADGTNVRRLTVDQGYDGAGCFSPDGKSICYQAYHPREETERAEFVDLLAKHQVSSARLDIWVMQADGSGRGQVTDLEATSMEPSFTPDNKRIIFSSDYQDAPGRQFDLYITKLDGGTPEKITNDPSPDCFPMFSPNGRYLAFTSGRGSAKPGAQDVFIAEWKE
jgi:dipeptidyl aminopeptidase/acylaminoacyl peptidase